MSAVPAGPSVHPRSAPALPFPADPRGSPDDTGPRSLAIPGSSSRELRHLFRVRFALHPPDARTRRAPPLGFRLPPSRHWLEESTSRRHSKPPTFRPQRFSRSRRLTPPRAARACFIPLPRPRFTVQGLSPGSQPNRLIVDPFPSCRSSPFSCGRVAPPLRTPALRLQGFDPTTGS